MFPLSDLEHGHLVGVLVFVYANTPRFGVSAKVVTGYLGGGKSAGASSVYDSLTHREREVLKLVAEAKSNKFIAEFLNLSVKTVEKHRSNLMSKLDVHNASELTAYAIEKGLVVG